MHEDLLIADVEKSIREQALHCFNKKGFVHYTRYHVDHLDQVLKPFSASTRTRFDKLSKKACHALFHGTGERVYEVRFRYERRKGSVEGRDRRSWPGLVPLLQDIWEEYGPRSLRRFQSVVVCPDCSGARLRPQALSVFFQDRNIAELASLTIEEATQFFAQSWKAIQERGGSDEVIGRELFRELLDRLRFLDKVGLGYLRLHRSAATLSGGESQRIRLAAQVGSGLRGILYVLDEPSIGLHARDNARLIETLKELRDRGNTVCVIEHDEETMRASDYLVDVGPGAGILGGEIVAAGTPAEVEQCEDSLTAAYLSGKKRIEIPKRRSGPCKMLGIRGASQHNLKNLDIDIPLGRFVCVTGVSGSGKSSLVHHVLEKALARELNGADVVPGKHRRITGLSALEKVIEIDQDPIGRTPRSNPATYSKVWSEIRDLFTSLPESRVRGYPKGRFSFNVKGGRCESCEGAGVRRLEMQFLESVEVECEVCEGKRFNRETLEILYRGRSIHDILEMDIKEALQFFTHHPKIRRILEVLERVGLGYLHLGQTSTTLSGGEAQRVKLAAELARPGHGKTFYILDEPTTGLHFEDVSKLLETLQELVDLGNTVLVIEHNLDVVKSADWLIDLGPEGGDEGGELVVCGTPEEVARTKRSYTGIALAPVLARGKKRMPARKARAKGKGAAAKRAVAKQHGVIPLQVTGARQHNLKGVNASFPPAAMTVVTGLSGSGKSSLAFDTLFQEGQRRFVESLSTYARRFLGRLDRAPVDKITGLLPAIAIDQKTAGRNPRSTVGTSTEILDYLRLLFARVGQPHCPEHGEALVRNHPSTLAARVAKEWDGKKGYVLAPVRVPGGLEDRDLLSFAAERLGEWKEEGFVRYALLTDEGVIEHRLEELPKADQLRRAFYLVVDRISFGKRSQTRLAEAFELAQRFGKGLVAIAQRGGLAQSYSLERSCTRCGFHLPLDLHPRFFSFNHHSGACATCQGIGTKMRLQFDKLIKKPDKPLFHGAIAGSLGPGIGWLFHPEKSLAQTANAMAENNGFDLRKTPFSKLGKRATKLILEGSGNEVYDVVIRRDGKNSTRSYRVQETWPGIRPLLEERYAGTESLSFHGYLSRIMREEPCPACAGTRLSAAVLGVKVGNEHIASLSSKTVAVFSVFLDKLELGREEQEIAREILTEIRARLRFLDEMGLAYLELDRKASTLSGGEAQRIRLASQLGSRLTGTLYVLDEPTVGLHPRDTERLLRNLDGLKKLGNTVVAVEHDEAVIMAADWVIDLGPGAGREGGEIVYEGKPEGLVKCSASWTGRWMRRERELPLPKQRRKGNGRLRFKNVCVNNLQGINVDFPLAAMTVVTGVSGSGKSSLVMEAVLPALQGETGEWNCEGAAQIEQLVVVDQEAIGTSPRSCPATYMDIFTAIRELFARTEVARRLGFSPGRFSFNNYEGRCPHCEGRGERLVEMHFLADVWVLCELCRGKRYNEQTLEVQWRSKNIAQILELEAREALDLFAVHKKIAAACRTLVDVGLGYLKLGQGVHTLSGGEAQRLKLAAELCKPPRKGSLYLLDEPSTGLHMEDIAKLMAVLQRLLDRSATVIVIEHHMEVAKLADWVIDLGPGAGDAGGRVVVAGTPEKVAACRESVSAKYLGRALRGQSR